MRFYNYLLEFKINSGYAGRDIVSGQPPIIWMVINKPPLGLIWSDTKGSVYQFDKRMGKIEDYSIRMTHKNLLAAAYEKLGLSGNMRKNIDDIVDNYMDVNIRGRVVKDVIFVYDGANRKLSNKAIDIVSDYVPES